MSEYQFTELSDFDKYTIIKMRIKNLETTIFNIDMSLNELEAMSDTHPEAIDRTKSEREEKIKYLQEVLIPQLHEMEKNIPEALRV